MTIENSTGSDLSYAQERNETERRLAIGYLLFAAVTHFMLGLLGLTRANSLIAAIFDTYSLVPAFASSLHAASRCLSTSPCTASAFRYVWPEPSYPVDDISKWVVLFSLTAFVAIILMAKRVRVGSIVTKGIAILSVVAGLWNVTSALISAKAEILNYPGEYVWPLLWSSTLTAACWLARPDRTT
jgi:hypothetical protein